MTTGERKTLRINLRKTRKEIVRSRSGNTNGGWPLLENQPPSRTRNQEPARVTERHREQPALRHQRQKRDDRLSRPTEPVPTG